jgi:hypothetical protein
LSEFPFEPNFSACSSLFPSLHAGKVAERLAPDFGFVRLKQHSVVIRLEEWYIPISASRLHIDFIRRGTSQPKEQ